VIRERREINIAQSRAKEGEGARRAIEIKLDPDDTLPCKTPLDHDAKDDRLREADDSDLARAGPILVLGGARFAGELREGEKICGWTRYIAQPGLGYPAGWEGELFDASGELLAAWSWYLERGDTKHRLSRSWRFSREGAPRRLRIDEGGAFVYHDAIRVHHGGASAVSKNGEEVILKSRNGTFAVLATSDLTEGNVPVFVSKHDGFFFSAVRVRENPHSIQTP